MASFHGRCRRHMTRSSKHPWIERVERHGAERTFLRSLTARLHSLQEHLLCSPAPPNFVERGGRKAASLSFSLFFSLFHSPSLPPSLSLSLPLSLFLSLSLSLSLSLPLPLSLSFSLFFALFHSPSLPPSFSFSVPLLS